MAIWPKGSDIASAREPQRSPTSAVSGSVVRFRRSAVRRIGVRCVSSVSQRCRLHRVSFSEGSVLPRAPVVAILASLYLPSDAEPSNAPLKTTSHNSRLNLPINGRGRSQAMLRRRPWPYGQKGVTLLRLESLSAAQPARYQDPWCVVGVAPFVVSV